jgi:hypothetical protein
VHAARQKIALKLAADAPRQAVHLLRYLLHQQKVGMLAPDQPDDIVK